MPRDPQDCLCPSFQPHRPGCPGADGAIEAPPAEAAATRVRARLSAAKGQAAPLAEARPAVVTALVTEDGPLGPNQILHQVLGLVESEGIDRVMVVYRDRDGFWGSAFSDGTPDGLLAGATSLRLDAEIAFMDHQEHLVDGAGD